MKIIDITTLVLFAPAIESRFKINEKNIQINYDTHINKSIIYEYPSEFFNGSAFFTFWEILGQRVANI